jgi:gliding motility-associated-like protein
VAAFRKYVLAFSCLLSAYTGRTQAECPANIDFEYGSFDYWSLAWGQVGTPNGFNEVNWFGYSQEPSRHQVITAPDTTKDRYGNFPRLCPNGSGHSVVLGNDDVGGQAEMIAYDFVVPSNATEYSIFFHYAVVLEDPSHNTEQQPRFRARLINLSDNLPIECVNFDFTASGSLPGFEMSNVKPNVLYKNWTPITLDLTPFSGQALRLEFITSDCTLQGHFGYAYIDVSGVCNGAISGSVVCVGDAVGELTAPFGFNAYTWYSDASFSTIISNSQTLILNPPPSVGATFPVILEPYPGFGCRDTVYATITSAVPPPVDAGIDKTICTYDATTLGKPPDPGLQYSWVPADNLANPLSSQPTTLTNLQGPTVFVLTVTDPQTGCKKTDDVVVYPVIIDTAMTISGELIFCNDDVKNTSLLLTGANESVRWFGANQLVSGANGFQYDPKPSFTTTYYAELTRQGCRDTSRSVTVMIPPDPVPSFRPERKMQCVDIPLTFLNTSRIPGNEVMDFVWRLANGSEFQTKDLVTVFNSAGPQLITLRASSASGCSDSVSMLFDIVDHCNVNVPTAFTPNADGLNDIFKPSLNGIKGLRRFAVYDRWGNLIYSTRTLEEGWDGMRGGIKMDAGVYVWMIEYDSYDREHLVLRGTVTLIR